MSYVLEVICGGLGNYKMSVEAAEEEEFTMEKGLSGNVRSVACAGPPKGLKQSASDGGPSHVLRFASDQRGISSCRSSVRQLRQKYSA